MFPGSGEAGGAAGSAVQAPEGQGSGEQTRTHSTGQACSSGLGLHPPSRPRKGARPGTKTMHPACLQGWNSAVTSKGRARWELG